MKKFYYCLFFILTLFLTNYCHAQHDTLKPVKVAVFIPLYTDSVFNGGVYTLGKNNLPKNVLPGLEFYNGVMMAIDSLNQEGTFAEINIYDTKQDTQSLISVLSSADMNNVGLIIAAITNTTELKTFSEYALAQSIPLISATYPNYVGVKENPYFFLLNSSFQAHLEGLHKYMQKNYAKDSIIAITRKGGQYETFIKNYITGINKATRGIPLKLKWISLDDKMVTIDVLNLDSVKNNIIFVATPMEKFGLDVIKAINSDRYKVTAIGMPTWDNIKELDKASCKNIEIVYSTPFLYNNKSKPLNTLITNRYKNKFFSRPSDMVFKGYEVTYHFTRLLIKHRTDLINHLGDKDFIVFNEFKPEPVKMNKTSARPDFIENKKLYFIKKQQGIIKAAG